MKRIAEAEAVYEAYQLRMVRKLIDNPLPAEHKIRCLAFLLFVAEMALQVIANDCSDPEATSVAREVIAIIKGEGVED